MEAISLCLVYQSKRFRFEIERSPKCVRARMGGDLWESVGMGGNVWKRAGMGGNN